MMTKYNLFYNDTMLMNKVVVSLVLVRTFQPKLTLLTEVISITKNQVEDMRRISHGACRRRESWRKYGNKVMQIDYVI